MTWGADSQFMQERNSRFIGHKWRDRLILPPIVNFNVGISRDIPINQQIKHRLRIETKFILIQTVSYNTLDLIGQKIMYFRFL